MEVNNLFENELLKIQDIILLKDEPLKNHTTFKIGGMAKYFVCVKNETTLLLLINFCSANSIKYMIIGNGSNLLFSDKGYDGAIIKLEEEFNYINIEQDTEEEYALLTAGAGASLARVAKEASNNNLSGLEFASGIPGTVGGAVLMNAGAYDGEIGNVCIKSRYIDNKNRSVKIYEKQDMDFSYRHSIYQNTLDIILNATFKLKKCINNSCIEEKMKSLNARRKEKQPLEYPSAGSTFKRPSGYYAGKLIEDCGLKGYRHGDAMVSEKHSGFVINVGNATFDDVISVIEHVKEVVYNNTGVIMEPEVKIII